MRMERVELLLKLERSKNYITRKVEWFLDHKREIAGGNRNESGKSIAGLDGWMDVEYLKSNRVTIVEWKDC